ncbi:MAG: MFS transporter [Deltaproteobacteria bacterium]
MPTKASWHHPVLPWIIWGIGASYFFYDYINQVVPGIIGSSLIQTFNVSAAALGTLSAYYFYSYAVMQIPVGLIVDHYGPHRPLVIAALFAAGGNLLLAQASTFSGVEIYRLLVGFGAAFSYVGALKLISNWFPASRFATLAGMTNTLGMIGAIVGTAPFADLVVQVGWRGSLLANGVLGAGLAVLILLVVRDHPRGAVAWHEHLDKERGLTKVWDDLKHVVGLSQFWILGVYITTMNITFTAVGAVWGPSRIQKVYGIDAVHAAGVIYMLFMGGIFGALFFGWFSDRLRRRKLPMLIASCSALLVMVLLLYGPRLPLTAAYIMMFLQGFACNGLILGYSVAHDIRPSGSAGAAEGFANTICAGGTAIFLPIIGWLLAFSIHFARSFLIAALTVAVLMAVLSRETHCQELYTSD